MSQIDFLESEIMSVYHYSICDGCPHRKCKAYSCNMRDELDTELYTKFQEYEDIILPQMIKEWKKNNKIVKEY